MEVFSRALSLFPCIPQGQVPSLSVYLPISIFLSFTSSLFSLTLSLSLSLARSLALAFSLSLSRSYPLLLAFSLSPPFSLSLSPLLSLAFYLSLSPYRVCVCVYGCLLFFSFSSTVSMEVSCVVPKQDEVSLTLC